MKKIILFSLCTIVYSVIFGQKSNKDSLILEFKKYEITEQDYPLIGKQKVITGTVLIKKGKKKIATHDFIVPIIKEQISHIAVLGIDGQKIEPRIHYNSTDKLFTYFEGTDKAGQVKVNGDKDQKELVLFGLWVWAQLMY